MLYQVYKNPKRNPYVKRGLLALGVFVLMYAALNFGYISTISRHNVKEVREEIREQQDVSANIVVPDLHENELAIPVINIRAPIVQALEKNETAFQAAAREGVAHYPETAEVGQVGNVFIFGHSSDWIGNGNEYRNVFALIPKLESGDLVFASNTAGEIFAYKVDEGFVVSPNDTWVLEQDTDGKSILTLQTSYPFGTAVSRYVVRATMVESLRETAETDNLE